MVTSTTLATGEAQGTLTVRVCSDPSCTTVYGETALPYDFTVEPNSNMTPIAPLPGVSDWSTGGGSASRASDVPISLDPASFTVRWLQPDMEQLEPAGDVADGSSLVTDSADQEVIMTVPATLDANSATVATDGGLLAYSESDATPVWHETLMDSSGAAQEPGPLAISNGIVYATDGPDIDTGGYGGDVSFTGLSATTGAAIFTTQLLDTFNQNYGVQGAGCGPGSPLISAGMAFINPGCIPQSPDGSSPLPIAAFSATTGQLQWTSSALGGQADTAVASDGTDLYYLIPLASSQPALASLAATTGAEQWQTTVADGARYTYMSPVLDGSGGAITVANTPNGPLISRYDLASGQLKWQITLPPTQMGAAQAIAVGNGVIYVGSDATVTALNLADGSTAWSWSAASDDETPLNGLIVGTNVNSLIVTNNLLFVGTDHGVYAVELSTHQTVWALATPGYALAISPSGILYVVTSEDSVESTTGVYLPRNEALLAVNLQ
jgi:outer membrane protein assembly factor BamB